MNTRVENPIELPIYYRIPAYLLDSLPPPNTIKGLFAWSFMFYLLSVVLRIIAGYLNKGVEKRIEKERAETYDKIKQRREQKTEDAMKLLQKM